MPATSRFPESWGLDSWPVESWPWPDDGTIPATAWPTRATPAFLATADESSAQENTVQASSVGTLGDLALGAAAARATYGVTGAGITVGILSDSFNVTGLYAADILSGALPANVTVLKEGPAGSSDEGRAMAELIHQVAPGAALAFYSAFYSMADFAAGILALAAAGAKVIVDDVTYLNEPFFQEGSAIDAAIETVVAEGVSYFTAASNEGTAFYQAAFTGLAVKLPGLAGSYLAENFGTAAAPHTTQALTIAPGATITFDLQWDQPFASIGGNGTANSLGLVLYNSAGKIVATALANRTGGDPVQILRFTNTTASSAFSLAIVTNGGSLAPDLFKYIIYGQGAVIDDPNAGQGSGTVTGHEMLADANTVGAIAAANAPALGGSGQIESFSSAGPGMILFDAEGNRLTDAVSGQKVDFVAPDGIATSVFSTFYGTSAAAPDAAAVAALMLQANPTLAPAQVTSLLDQSAVPVTGASGATGAGLVQAATAVALAEAAAGASTSATSAATPAQSAATPGTAASTAQTSHWQTSPTSTPSAAVAAQVASDPTAASDFLAVPEVAGTAAETTADSSSGLSGGTLPLALAMLPIPIPLATTHHGT